jgi:hypothetical protein
MHWTQLLEAFFSRWIQLLHVILIDQSPQVFLLFPLPEFCKSLLTLFHPQRFVFLTTFLLHFVVLGPSASLFNLYPVCANCNNIKREEKVFLELYQDSPPEHSDFSFKLNIGVQTAFLLDRTYEKIEFTFEPPSTPKGYVNFDELFDIKGIYQTQKDVIEEMILKAESYSKGYKETLKASLPEIFKDDMLIERLIVGNYTKDKDIHKRPLAKFSRDMAIAVGLLKDEDKH